MLCLEIVSNLILIVVVVATRVPKEDTYGKGGGVT